MQDMRFLIVGKQGPVNHGVILSHITEGKYLCEFAKNPTSCRVCDITEIQTWNLFHTDEQMNAFILSLRKEQAPLPVEDPKVELPPIPIKKTKKKASKKKAKKKAKTKKKVKHNGAK